MSNIPKSRRKATSLDALALAQNIRSEITTELMLTFGYSEKRLEQHIRKVTDYIQDDALRERAAAQLRETNQDFSMWFIEKERDEVLRLSRGISAHLRAANTISPVNMSEFEERTEDLMDEIFKTFEMDVSRFSDEDIEAMINGKVDPFMNMGVPKELLTGEKMLAKGADIGNQLAQNIGITFPYRIDNYCKIVCGMKHQGRYSDDMHIIHRSKEVLLGVLEGIKKIAAEYGLILNEKKTHICKLSSDYRYLQVKYTLLQNGIVVRRIHPKAITRERRKLKAYKRLLDKGIVTMEEIDGYFRSWLSGNYKYMSRDQIYKMNSLYVKLFGRSVTWKKGHGRLRWLMAHPSAA